MDQNDAIILASILSIAKVILSFSLALLGKKRLIGYWLSFVCFIFFGVGIGLIITLCSPKKDNPNINFEKISHRRRTEGNIFIVLGIIWVIVTILCFIINFIIKPGSIHTDELISIISVGIILNFPIAFILFSRSKKFGKKYPNIRQKL